MGHSIHKISSKFGHSSEFRVFSLESIENLVLNLRLKVFIKNLLFAMAQVCFMAFYMNLVCNSYIFKGWTPKKVGG